MGARTDPCPPDNWITQLKWCFSDFNKTLFYHVNTIKQQPEEWKDLVNIHSISLDEMWKRLNR